ncbi:aldehyde dehydrogenase family protein, partial [Pseudomonas otitidis]
NPLVQKLSFTGSTGIGKLLMAQCTETIKKVSLELGGKSPNIYFEDIMQAEPAFIEKAAEGLVLAFFNQG